MTEMKKQLILASGSPRRKEILENTGFSFEVFTCGCNEDLEKNTPPEKAAGILAERKAKAAFCELTEKGRENFAVIGSDTVVASDGKILGKPESRENAVEMLFSLSGKTHSVFTGVCVISDGFEETFVNETKVEFYTLSRETCEKYAATGEPDDKAGAYGIQGLGSVLVKSIEGDFFSVMGLPAAETARCLKRAGVSSEKDIL